MTVYHYNPNRRGPMFDPAKWQALQKLPTNLLGRDFIVPDAHGCLQKLRAHLSREKFDPKHDRLFLLGDLADRGPMSFEMLELLLEPWVFAILGNHEAMLLSWLGRRVFQCHDGSLLLKHGGDWVLRLTPAQRKKLDGPIANKLLALPLVLQVDHPTCPFQMVHSELLTHGGHLPDRVFTNEDLTEEMVRKHYRSFLWGRRLVEEAISSCDRMLRSGLEFEVEGVLLSSAPVEPGLSLTYAGHSIVSRMMLHRSHVFMDRGAFLQEPGFGLTIIEHNRFAKGLTELDQQ